MRRRDEVTAMTWQQTHERYLLLNRAEAHLRADPEGRLPWSEEYAAAYSSPEALAQALLHRWRIRFQALDEDGLDAEVRAEAVGRLRRAMPPLLPWLARPGSDEELAAGHRASA